MAAMPRTASSIKSGIYLNETRVLGPSKACQVVIHSYLDHLDPGLVHSCIVVEMACWEVEKVVHLVEEMAFLVVVILQLQVSEAGMVDRLVVEKAFPEEEMALVACHGRQLTCVSTQSPCRLIFYTYA